MGALVEAQRIDLFRVEHHPGSNRRDVSQLAWWMTFGMPQPAALDPNRRLPLQWFPWSLGNIHSDHHVFVSNAGALPLEPSGRLRLRDLGVESALYLPLFYEAAQVGGLCAGWAVERSEWDSEQAFRLWEWGVTILVPPPSWGSWAASPRGAAV